MPLSNSSLEDPALCMSSSVTPNASNAKLVIDPATTRKELSLGAESTRKERTTCLLRFKLHQVSTSSKTGSLNTWSLPKTFRAYAKTKKMLNFKFKRKKQK
jgi:hypothetical protein